MRVFRRRRIQDYQLRSTTDSKPTDETDSVSVPELNIDGITDENVNYFHRVCQGHCVYLLNFSVSI